MGQADTIYLVRHAKAGERRLWTGDDVDRPLSKRGWKQSAAVAKRLSAKKTTSLYSSSYVRCMQTLEPLAELTGQKVHTESRLFEDEPFEPVLELLGEVENGSVLCSHGDIIPATIQALHRRGMIVETPANWGKSSIWVLRRKGTKITKGKVWPATC
ncbi:SixA phosphatase family protein [Ilumatobacter sp.]|uniref:SixA phosphatase family protein n=1 Tax=Ilumatobacter sp. TaxID=1967498 RepID=UPI003C62CED8